MKRSHDGTDNNVFSKKLQLKNQVRELSNKYQLIYNDLTNQDAIRYEELVHMKLNVLLHAENKDNNKELGLECQHKKNNLADATTFLELAYYENLYDHKYCNIQEDIDLILLLGDAWFSLHNEYVDYKNSPAQIQNAYAQAVKYLELAKHKAQNNIIILEIDDIFTVSSDYLQGDKYQQIVNKAQILLARLRLHDGDTNVAIEANKHLLSSGKHSLAEEVKLNKRLADLCNTRNSQEAIDYYKKAAELQTQLLREDVSDKSKNLILLLDLYTNLVDLYVPTNTDKDLKSLYNNLVDKTEEILEIKEYVDNISFIKKAADFSYKLAKLQKGQNGEALSYQKAIKHYHNVLKLENNNTKIVRELADSFYKTGDLYAANHDMNNSIASYQESIKHNMTLSASLNYDKVIAKTLYELHKKLADIYSKGTDKKYSIELYKLAFDYANKCFLDGEESTQDTIQDVLIKIGGLYFECNDYKNASACFNNKFVKDNEIAKQLLLKTYKALKEESEQEVKKYAQLVQELEGECFLDKSAEILGENDSTASE